MSMLAGGVMNNVLIVASHTPPYHQGQVMRVAKLTKYLPNYNWESVIVSAVTEPGMERITDLTADIAKAKKIYRANYLNLVKCYHAVKSIFSKSGYKSSPITSNSTVGISTGSSLAAQYLLPDYYVTWIPFAVLSGIKALFAYKIRAIYSLSPLPSNLVVGYILHKLSGKPWVVDLRDPWTTNPIASKRAHVFLDKIDIWLERIFLQSCHKIVVINKQFIPPLLLQHPTLDPDKFIVVPNGYDPEDFQHVEKIAFQKFTIVHSGKFYEDRSPEPFLKALHLLMLNNPDLATGLQVKLLGASDTRTAHIVNQLGLDTVVELIDFVPHNQSLQYILSADCLLLIPGPGASTMTGKIFEYLASGKPIIALAGKGAAGDLISTTHTGVVVSPDDVPGIANAIFSMFNAKSTGHSNAAYCNVDNEVLKQFDRREIARKVASLLDKIIEGKR
jgi:glycosyltransferase involved in cell wall biosynthesis